jgi:hypothetical protein
MAHRKSDSPTGHVEGLGEAVKFNPHFLGTVHLHETERLISIESDFGVGGIVANNDFISTSKGHDLFEERPVGDGRRGIVRVVDEKKLRLFCDLLWNF